MTLVYIIDTQLLRMGFESGETMVYGFHHVGIGSLRALPHSAGCRSMSSIERMILSASAFSIEMTMGTRLSLP